jgi:3-vinyl bacteriochlorophyllide hydratase
LRIKLTFIDPWAVRRNSVAGTNPYISQRDAGPRKAPLYTPEQRRRRDSTRWTLVQGILAPVQFAIFLASLFLVLRYLATGEGYEAATYSIIAKTFALYLIMVTGSLWEHAVFGKYLLAPGFYWEDMVSFVVIFLHTAYLVALFTNALGANALMLLALAAYFTYVINAGQFLLKLRAARLEAPRIVELTSEGLEVQS